MSRFLTITFSARGFVNEHERYCLDLENPSHLAFLAHLEELASNNTDACLRYLRNSNQAGSYMGIPELEITNAGCSVLNQYTEEQQQQMAKHGLAIAQVRCAWNAAAGDARR